MREVVKMLSIMLFVASAVLIFLSAIYLVWSIPVLPVGAKLIVMSTFGMFVGIVGIYVTDQVEYIRNMLDD